MKPLHELYRIEEGNLDARRQFICLEREDITTLARLRKWAEKAVPGIVRIIFRVSIEKNRPSVTSHSSLSRLQLVLDSTGCKCL